MTADRYIGPTKERLAKAGEDVAPATTETGFTTIRMMDGHPLQRLLTRKKISSDQFAAGTRYFEDAYKAGLLSSGVVDTSQERVDCMSTPSISDSRLAAQTRYANALRALDYDKAHIIGDVVIREIPLSEYSERYRRFPQKRERDACGLVLLDAALTQLMNHYWPPKQNHSDSQHRAMRGVIIAGYRPIIPQRQNQS